MKYIQVFESWLNEAEEAKFDPNKPQAFPMLKMTQGQLYNENEDTFKKILASMYSRSIEKKEKSETDPYSLVNVFAIKINSLDSEKRTMSFKFAKAQKDVSITTTIKAIDGLKNSMSNMEHDVKSKEGIEKIKYAYLIYPKSTDKSKVITKSEDGSIKVSTDSAIIVILPEKPYDESDLAIDQDAICIYTKGDYHSCTISQTCSYISFEMKVPGTLSASHLGNKKFFTEKIFKST